MYASGLEGWPRNPAARGSNCTVRLERSAARDTPGPRDRGAGRVRTKIWGYVRRRPVATVFLLALAVRMTMVLAGELIPESWIANDDTTYSALAAQMATGATGDWSPYLATLYSATATFLVPLTGLYWLFGPVEWTGQALVAIVGAGLPAVATKLSLEKLETRWAISVGIVLAFLPSQVAWSVVLLKDPWVWLCTALIAWFATLALRTPGRTRVLAVLGITVTLFLLGHLRMQTTFVAAWALVATASLVPKQNRVTWIGGALLVAVSVPWLAGGGPGGIDPVLARAGNFQQTRIAAAAGADSGIVEETNAEAAGATVATDPDRQTSDGFAGRILRDIRHLPRGLSVMLLEPYPWDPNRNLRVVFAKIETVLWYPILGLAIVGTTQVKRHPGVLVFPIVLGSGTALGYALAQGNLGTAFRHRGELVWIALLLAAYGLRSLRQRAFATGHGRPRPTAPPNS